MSASLLIPIATSALVQISSIMAVLLPGVFVGVLTYDEERLGEAHLEAFGVGAIRIRIRGIPKGGHLHRVIQKGEEYNQLFMELEMVDAAVDLVNSADAKGEKLEALVLECTQMPPFAEAIQ
ncbi:hypothetical protein BU23DRAFT_571511 [Bimuria novae-zelandiae CBS 107.79]|uniref:Uncharacterized protein n=1 Tax=Bimuria novae-zelandiae CBS 107.79 TaxID=1447943 RepID=A0A6A5UW72_9PLEO|nr:hypothetical protein BU23DRAFT_571511 [Bimuria novae-zelandiae CBS 107.79]